MPKPNSTDVAHNPLVIKHLAERDKDYQAALKAADSDFNHKTEKQVYFGATFSTYTRGRDLSIKYIGPTVEYYYSCRKSALGLMNTPDPI